MTTTHEDEYLIWLASLSTEEELIQEINSIIEREQNEATLEKIINCLLEEISIIDSLQKDATIEELKLLKEDKINVNKKIKILRDELKKYEEKRKKEEELEKLGTSNILFAKNNYGNTLIEIDLKKIETNSSAETYQSFINLITKLFNNENNFNETKQKPTQSQSDKIKGIYELKDYQSRLLYRYCKDHIIIIGATTKKTDIDKKYREFCVNRKEQSDYFIKKLEINSIDLKECKQETINSYINLTSKGVKNHDR